MKIWRLGQYNKSLQEQQEPLDEWKNEIKKSERDVDLSMINKNDVYNKFGRKIKTFLFDLFTRL